MEWSKYHSDFENMPGGFKELYDVVKLIDFQKIGTNKISRISFASMTAALNRMKKMKAARLRILFVS